jgi:acyl-CoA synthetase (AMP-forming)/AMP-acid ligase II
MVSLINHQDFLPENLKSLRLINNVAPIETLRSFQNKVPQASLVSAYGLTEVGGVTSFGSPEDSLEDRISTCGKPWPGAEIRILNPETNEVLGPDEKGLIEIRGKHVFSGYLNDKKATENALSSDGWFSSGDIGSLSKEGHIRFHGRLKDMLKVGGENVAALEIEAYFDSHEEVLISQVVGVDDDHLGEVPALFVERKPGSKISKEDLIVFSKGQISNFKIPRYIVFIDDWPMSSTKVQKFKLKNFDLGEKVFGK